MNLDELQSIRDRERQSDSLQQLRESFYADAGEFVQNLREERDAAAARADDPFDAPEVNRLTDNIKTAEQTVEAIYERRVGKLVKMASFAAADMPTEDEGLTTEERELFDQLVASIETNREQVFAILDGEVAESQSSVDPMADPDPKPGTDQSPTPDPASNASDGVDAADLMGGTGESASETESADAADSDGSDRPPSEADATIDRTAESTQRIPPDQPSGKSSGESDGPDVVTPDSDGPESQKQDAAGDGGVTSSDEQASDADPTDAGNRPAAGTDGDSRSDGGTQSQSIERRTVKITRDIGEILGVDEREYDLSAEDVVTLPATNADPLVERDAAERLD
ncbi:MAG: hypothetical protein ABEI77_05510 [Halorientalis sp.]